MDNGITVGMDMGDQKHMVCIIDSEGEVRTRTTVTNSARAIQKHFSKLPKCRIALEAGTHSGWVSRILEAMGHEVLVGNPRKLRVIWDSEEKSDERDAEMLARIARFDPHLLYPIHHRGQEAHRDLAVIRSRVMLVKCRSTLVSHARGIVKSMGYRISKCSTESFHLRLNEEMPPELRPALEPILKCLEDLTARIRHYDTKVEELCKQKYPETELLRQVTGVGPLTSLAFVLTIEDSSRFKKSRSVGAYLGLVPKRDQSGQRDKQLGITKAGDCYMRSLLVGSAQYILGAFGPDCDLRRFGLRVAESGGKNAKRRAVVAVARKLSVLLHHLWKTADIYDPFYHSNRTKTKAA